MENKTQRIFNIQKQIMAGGIISGYTSWRGQPTVVTVGPYQSATSLSPMYAVIVRGDLSTFLSALGAAAHFVAVTQPGYDCWIVELEELPVIEVVEAEWPL